MEPASLALTVPSLFQTALQCFQYVQIGKKFDRDFGTNRLFLDNVRFRLARWGQGAGLPFPDEPSCSEGIPPALDDNAVKLLQHIITLLNEARAVTGTFEPEQSTSGGASDGASRSQRTLGRFAVQAGARFGKKTAWAIHGKANLESLIEDISDLIDALREQYPQEDVAYCDKEAARLHHDPVAPRIREIAAEHDKSLQDAFARLDSKEQRTKGFVFHNTGNSKIWNQISGDQNISGTQNITF